MNRGIAQAIAAAALCLLAVGCGAAPVEPVEPVAAAAPPSVAATVPALLPRDAPVSVRIPSIGVDSSIVGIATDATGALVPPPTTDVVGWFTAGPAPGDPGPALIAAHVDSRAGPGVFFRLRDLEIGDRISVTRSGGATVDFTVTRRTQTPKAAFPTDLVYDPAPGPELRLVTCGGTFDRSIRSYRDNIVVEAVADATTWSVPPQ